MTSKPLQEGPGRRTSTLISALLLIAAAGWPPALAQDPPRAEPPARPRLSPVDFKVFGTDRPITGTYRFAHPVTGEMQQLFILPAPEGEEGLVGSISESSPSVLTLVPKREGVGWEGELRGLLTTCGQDRVPISEVLPLGDKVILRMDARLSDIPCPFLEDRTHSRLVVAPSAHPIRLRDAREIVSESTREKIGLAGQPGGVSSPIVADSVSVEGGTELTFVARTRSMDGSIWIEVEAIVSPAPGIEAPRGFVRADELRVDASLTLERLPVATGPAGY